MKFLSGTVVLLCLCIESQGQNVGIGTNTPLERLDITGGLRIGNTSSSNAGTLRFQNGRFEGFNGTSWNWLNGFRLPLDSAVSSAGTSLLRLVNTSTVANSHGITGQTAAAGGYGIFGNNTAATGAPVGVYGQHISPASGAGVYGRSLATTVTGEVSGVYAQNDGSAGTGAIAYGVYGNALGTSGSTIGVHGRSASATGRGVWGWATSTTGVNYGVVGQSASQDGIGVWARNTASGGMALVTQGGVTLSGISAQPGRVLTATDVFGNAEWRTAAFNANIRFSVAREVSSSTLTTRYNTDPQSISIGANNVQINRSGLYRFQGYYYYRTSYTGAAPSWLGLDLSFNVSGSASYLLAYQNPLMRNSFNWPTPFSYEFDKNFEFEIYITAPATISITSSLGFNLGAATSAGSTIYYFLNGHLISD